MIFPRQNQARNKRKSNFFSGCYYFSVSGFKIIGTTVFQELCLY